MITNKKLLGFSVLEWYWSTTAPINLHHPFPLFLSHSWQRFVSVHIAKTEALTPYLLSSFVGFTMPHDGFVLSPWKLQTFSLHICASHYTLETKELHL